MADDNRAAEVKGVSPHIHETTRHVDPALEPANQHHHGHPHHSGLAEKGPEDDIIYAKEVKSTIQEPSMSDQHRSHSDKDLEEAGESYPTRNLYHRYRKYIKHVFYAVIWLLFTGWWIAGLILHRYDLGWLIPFLLYLAITIRLITLYIPVSVVTRPAYWAWDRTARPFVRLIPERLRIPSAALLTIAVILVGSFASKETADNTRANRAVSLFGLVVFLFCLWATSRDRKKIVWHTVIVGMLVQFIVALFVLRTKAGYDIFNFVSTLARELLGFAGQGVDFLVETNFAATHTWFLITVIPAIIFFVSLVQLLYYSGVLQWAIGKFAVFFFWSMRVSGAEAVVAAASPFIGQGESAMLIKPFVAHLTRAEIHQVMCSGFATIAGSVLVAYIGMGVNPQALVSSCVMSIPASLAASKLRWPEEEETLTAGRVVVPEDEEHKAENALHAFSNGAWLGIKIAGMISATLLCIISLVGLINGLLTWWGRYLNINDPPLTLDLILGYICYPIAFLLGVSRDGDLLKVSKLIGVKLVMNEFVAYNDLQTLPEYKDISDRSRIIVTYALCGFANIGSLGNQIGVLNQLAPNRAGDVSRVAFSAMVTGALATFTSAAIAGLLITDEGKYIS
ncbi:NupC/NupG family nucleoside CNT transporter [Aspergillus clavatus NRRL 1]|uniref:H+/nucleoside cotransporter n=1 Tax=Aspergillus clavatus (strain ATCC 1007 / CBS 513.65 / DSM 816 / NCTC 3887 / NRRL 1 / QM 1276 / 107) TaxID=344612 RepID=A1CUF7_ASPCL|nr:H+/nucleoside cotransporter [Aspergillus clavatus NRRL 1]EAW06944.1 H+/nucleoside cotransporter [Aspergillus clavatus NRRL 1]